MNRADEAAFTAKSMCLRGSVRKKNKNMRNLPSGGATATAAAANWKDKNRKKLALIILLHAIRQQKRKSQKADSMVNLSQHSHLK